MFADPFAAEDGPTRRTLAVWDQVRRLETIDVAFVGALGTKAGPRARRWPVTPPAA